MRCLLAAVALFFIVCGATAVATAAAPELRVALVIGNGAYANAPLANPANDARLMAETLRGLGFDVIERTDANQKTMKLAIFELGDRLEAAGRDAVGLFYYAGHGVQVDGENYLIPLGAAIEKERHVAIEAVGANWVLGQMEFAGNRVNFVILDACRNNPLTRGFRSRVRGLARMNAPTGSLVAYSTGPGDVAADGEGANSPYTLALSQVMQTPGLPAEKVFKLVRDAVRDETKGEQTPWEESSMTGADFYFKPPTAALTLSAPTPKTLPAETVGIDRVFWESIKDSENPETYRAYLRQYPNGAFSSLARIRLDELQSVRKEAEVATLEAEREAAEQTEQKQASAEQAEFAFWETIKDSNDPADYLAYLEAYPDGSFSALARSRAEKKAAPITKVVQIQAVDDWRDSGVRVRRGERYRLSATGTWSIGPICGETDASGSGVGFLCGGDPWNISARGSTLIGRIGTGGIPFPIGNELDLMAESDGILYLMAYDTIRFDNSGAVTVRITELNPQQLTSAEREIAALSPGTVPIDGEWYLEILGQRLRTTVAGREFTAHFATSGWRGEISGKIDAAGNLIARGIARKSLGNTEERLKYSAEYSGTSFQATSTSSDRKFKIRMTPISP